MKPALSIVIPAKDEEKRIVSTLDKYGAFITSNFGSSSIEILVVVNNSLDRTGLLVDEYSKKYPFIKKIETVYATGKGGAVALGFSESLGDYIGYIDADGSVSPSDFFNLSRFLAESPKVDGVIGVRSFNKLDISFVRLLIVKLYNLYVKLFFNINYVDTQCSAKIFKSSAAKEVGKKLSSLGWVFDVNILLLCKYLNYRIVEKPVAWKEREGSKFSLSEAIFRLPIEILSLKRLELAYYAKALLPFDFFFPKNAFLSQKSIRKNILIFMWRDIKHPEHGGSEIYTFEVAKRLAKNNNVVWFTAKPPNLSSRDEIEGIKIFRKGGLFSVYIWAFLYYLFMFRKDVDYVIDTENGMSFFTPVYVRKPITFIIHHIHGVMWFKEFMPPLSIIGYFLEHHLMPFVYGRNLVITVSPSSKSEIKAAGFKEKRIFLAYNAIPLNGKKQVYKPSKTPLFLYHGRLKAYKRVDIAIRAFAILVKEFPNAELVISGVGSAYPSLVNLVHELKLEDSVKFLGYVSDEVKWEIMQKAWVFLMPSVVEGWGITIIEAASCGTPSVGFNVPGVRDSIKDNVTGLLSKDENNFIENIRILTKDRNLRETLGVNAKYWAGLFSWDKTTEVLKKVLEISSTGTHLLSDKTYPWDLEMRPDFLTSITDNTR